MEIQKFFEWFFDFLADLFSLLGTVSFTAFGVTVPYSVLIIACIVLVMIANTFWRGVQG